MLRGRAVCLCAKMEMAMRTEDEVEAHRQAAQRHVMRCKLCNMGGNPDCKCHERYRVEMGAFEACVPRDFWKVQATDITHNLDAFKEHIKIYAASLDKALKRGYGLLCVGPNGVGKSMFISYVLMKAIRAGRNAYYTTLPQLDYDMKLGFTDEAARHRLEWLLSSDFVAIDEVGKEHLKGEGSSFTKVQLERILKARFDDSMPVLLATNMGSDEVDGYYGPSLASIFKGKYRQVMFMAGDQRAKLSKKMEDDMGY